MCKSLHSVCVNFTQYVLIDYSLQMLYTKFGKHYSDARFHAPNVILTRTVTGKLLSSSQNFLKIYTADKNVTRLPNINSDSGNWK